MFFPQQQLRNRIIRLQNRDRYLFLPWVLNGAISKWPQAMQEEFCTSKTDKQ
jgi:hypothetical protein